MDLIDPFPGKYDASDPFGSMKGRTYGHTGSDWFAPDLADIPAIGAGVVVNAQWHSGNGNTVTVRLPDGHYFACLHMSAPAAVKVGQGVELGQALGKVGNTGTNSRGHHLHVTVSDAPTAYLGLGNRIDPWRFIQDHLAPDPTDPEETMPYSFVPIDKSPDIYVCSLVTGNRQKIANPDHMVLLQRYKVNGGADHMLMVELDIVRSYLQLINPTATGGGGALSDADAARLVKLINDDAAARLAR